MGAGAFRGAIVVLVVSAPGLAHAICGAPPPLDLSLHRGVVAPLNARPTVTARATWRKGKPLVLATAPRVGQPSSRVEVRERAWTSGDHERIELTPLKELASSTTYELQDSAGDVFGIFTTGTKADTTPPTWAGLISGSVWKPPKRGGVVRLEMECGDDLVVLQSSAAATDDQTPAASIRYALWAGDAKTPLDYRAPPLTWVRVDPITQRPPRFTFSFGTTEETFMDFALPKARPLKVGVKAVDLAGNESPASELTLN